MSDQQLMSNFAKYLANATPFPVEDEALWLKMVSICYTPEEAVLLDGMPTEEGKTVEEWAEIKKMDPAQAKQQMDRAAKKGTLWRTTEEGKTTYKLFDPAFYFGRSVMWPGEYNETAMEVAPLVNQFVHSISDKVPEMPMMGRSDNKVHQVPAHYITIPIEQTVEDNRQMLPYENVLDLLENHWSYYSVSACVCAVRYNLDPASHDCAYPLERCLHMDDLGRYIVENGMGREVTLEEAKEICRQANDAGLFHSLNPPTVAGLDTLCNCCPDCCWSVVFQQKFGSEHATIASNFIVRDNSEACIGCGKCVGLCPVKCRRLVLQKGAKGRITKSTAGYKKLGEKDGREVVFKNRTGKVARADLNACIGCGLCVHHCPTKCLTLVPRKEQMDPAKDMNEAFTWLVQAAEQE